jgi:hypothetical protein
MGEPREPSPNVRTIMLSIGAGPAAVDLLVIGRPTWHCDERKPRWVLPRLRCLGRPSRNTRRSPRRLSSSGRPAVWTEHHHTERHRH